MALAAQPKRWAEGTGGNQNLKPATVPLALTALLLTGCHTIDAARRLVAPSPAYEATLSQSVPSEIQWRAKYGESAYPDAVLVALFVRSVENHGIWEVSGASRVCGLDDYRQPQLLALRPLTVGDVYWPSSDVTAGERARAVEHGCTHLVAVIQATGPGGAITVVGLLPVAGEAPIQLELPLERPVLDTRRWGWFFVSPVLDAATIVAVPPIVLFVVVAESTDLQW